MLRVRLLDGNFTNCEILKPLFIVGDEHLLPQVGEVYTVMGRLVDKDTNAEGYYLEEIDISPYFADKNIAFNVNRFETVSNEFEATSYKTLGYWQGYVDEHFLIIKNLKLTINLDE